MQISMDKRLFILCKSILLASLYGISSLPNSNVSCVLFALTQWIPPTHSHFSYEEEWSSSLMCKPVGSYLRFTESNRQNWKCARHHSDMYWIPFSSFQWSSTTSGSSSLLLRVTLQWTNAMLMSYIKAATSRNTQRLHARTGTTWILYWCKLVDSGKSRESWLD